MSRAVGRCCSRAAHRRRVEQARGAQPVHSSCRACTRERDALDIEWGQLKLEQSAWATHGRVEQTARVGLQHGDSAARRSAHRQADDGRRHEHMIASGDDPQRAQRSFSPGAVPRAAAPGAGRARADRGRRWSRAPSICRCSTKDSSKARAMRASRASRSSPRIAAASTTATASRSRRARRSTRCGRARRK